MFDRILNTPLGKETFTQDFVLVSFLKTLKDFSHFSDVSTADSEQVNASWVEALEIV